MRAPLQPITKINLKLIQGFICVAEHKSFREAAALSGLSQSAISSQIKRLEEQLGVILFHRTTRRVQLTAEGEELLACAERAINEVELGLKKIQEAVDVRQGRISFACSPTIALGRLPPILAAFEAEYPDIELIVQESTAAQLLEHVRAQRVEFGIGPVIDANDLNFVPFMDDPLRALIPVSFGGDKVEAVSLRDLQKYPLLLLDRTTALRQLIEEAAEEQGIVLNTRYQFTQAQTLISMSAYGLGVAILPQVAIPEILPPSLRVVPITNPSLSRQLAIITLRGHSLSPAAARLVPLFQIKEE